MDGPHSSRQGRLEETGLGLPTCTKGWVAPPPSALLQGVSENLSPRAGPPGSREPGGGQLACPTSSRLPQRHGQQLRPERTGRRELPPEHQSLRASFEALLRRCSLSADSKTKRRLEEAAQRLECLYDKVCEAALSPHVLAGLHEVARCADAGSFERALAAHAQLAGCSSFSEVSSFMPALKAVLAMAQKLRA